METPGEQFRRVLFALEDLVGQEALLLGTQDLDPLPAMQARMAPLVTFLATHAGEADEALRHRVSAIVAQRRTSTELLAEQHERIRKELLTIHESRQRIARVAPAYGYRIDAPAAGRLSARG